MFRTLAVPALLLLVFSAAFGQSRALLRSFGDVKVNGVVTPSSIAVMDGDRIETGDHAAASLLLSGRIITVGGNSSVIYQNSSVVAKTGAAEVTTFKCANGNCAASSTHVGGTLQPVSTSSAINNADDKKKCISPKKPDKCD